MNTARDEINKWMREHIDQTCSALDLANKAFNQFGNVIGIDSFLWNDAQSIWDLHMLANKARTHA
jgi:hypothetical protein